MFLTTRNTRPRRHQEEQQGTTFKPKAAAVRISQLIAAGWHHQWVYKEWHECREDTYPPRRPNIQLHLPPAFPLEPLFRPGYHRMQRGSISQSLPFPFWLQTHCSWISWIALGTHSTNRHPIFSASARCTPHQLLLPGSVQGCLTPLLPTLHHSSPMPHILPALGGL